MAQLIKLNDYVSRYAWDIYRYPTQFIRLKQENWEKLNVMWEHAKHEKLKFDIQKQLHAESQTKQKRSFFKNLIPKRAKETATNEYDIEYDEYLAALPEDQLKYYFLDQLYPLQLKWATSTVSQVSFIDKKYEHHHKLKYLLQRFPDTFLILYRPVFSIQNAVVDCDTIFVSPIGIEIIHFLEYEEQAKVITGNDRSWTVEYPNHTTQILSPVYSLRRTEQVIRSILNTKELSFPIKKTILSRKNQLIYWQEPYQIELVDKYLYDDWLTNQQALKSPLKADQLKGAGLLLEYAQTNSVRRPEWENESSFIDNEE